IKNIVIVQNKIDLVTPEKAEENYKQIKDFLADSIYKDAPIIPVSANYDANIDALIETIEKNIPTPERDENKEPLMYIARSFDVNKPGTEISKLIGGVIGGSLIQGKLKVGDEIEIRPGISKTEKAQPTPITSKIVGLYEGKESFEEVRPGGLIGISTELDPSITKADGLVGNVLGLPGKMPPVLGEVELEYSLLERVDFDNPALHQNEIIVMSVGTTTTLGVIDKVKKNKLHIKLKHPICAYSGAVVALSRKIGQRWRLCGKGKLL
ncbi:MAG: translation initiation factor IF-2 subunit gamma, partial [Candidatus Micrarchaeia archaeon]